MAALVLDRLLPAVAEQLAQTQDEEGELPANLGLRWLVVDVEGHGGDDSGHRGQA